jgi:translation initiation factor IF-2
MSWISAGLAATIREWFSEGEHATAVETTEKVDLKKVRLKKKTTAKKPRAKKEKKPAAVEPAAEVEQAEPQAPTAVVVEEKPPEEVKPKPVEVPKEPEVIVPAGPILEKPAPAKLSGPQVIRVEAPEPVEPPRPKAKPKPRYDKPITEPLMYDREEWEETPRTSVKGKKTPKRHTERTFGRRRDDEVVDVVKKIKLTKWRQRDIEERQARLEAAGGESLRLRPARKIATKTHPKAAEALRPEKITINEPITVRNLSATLAVRATDIINKLMQQGVTAAVNEVISPDAAELVAMEFGTELVVEHRKTLEEQIRAEFDSRQKTNLERRSVVAAMLGHVDHGKTSLLDKIRSTDIAAGEAGGITQHIGAYQVSWDNKKVTFLDTPGHEAFTAMRARGANMTDVVVLTVAANDGVMPQTIEAIHHAKAAGVAIIVALNKMDLPGIDLNRAYAQLSEQGLTPAEWGGNTEVVKTSAITGAGISDLLEHLDYTAELLDLKADNTVPATGWVVEAKMSPQLGPTATVLIKEGLLSKGDIVLAGCTFGRVKRIKDSYGKNIKTATSSMPVEINGLSDVPQAGDRFYVLNDINKAKAAAEENQMLSRENSLVKPTGVTLDNLFSQIEAGKTKELNLIIRADVQGSVDVLTKYLSELSIEEVKVKILHAAPGGITEGDCLLAEASNAIIIGFNVTTEERVAKIAETKGIEIRLYDIIYRITEDLQKSMAGLLNPEEKEQPIGRAVIRAIFKISKLGTVAGCYVSDGAVTRNAKVRLIRDNVVIRTSLSIESLKHLKDDIREAKAGTECGIKIAKFDDVKVDDVLDFYEIVKVARTL